MAYNETLASRIRALVKDEPDMSERKMFGGVAFMAGPNMFVGVTNDDLMARVGAANHEEAIARPGAGPMTFTGRSMGGFLFVRPEGVATDEALRGWVGECLTYARSIPPRPAKASKPRPRKPVAR